MNPQLLSDVALASLRKLLKKSGGNKETRAAVDKEITRRYFKRVELKAEKVKDR